MKQKLTAFFLSAMLAAALSIPAAAVNAVPAQYADDERNYSTVAQGGYLYSAISGSLERISLETRKRDTLVKNNKTYDLDAFVVQNDWIYWTGGNAVYKCKTDGTGLVKLDAGGEADDLRVDVSGLYYLSRDTIYKMKLDGTGRKPLGVGEVEAFDLAGAWIYYQPEDSMELLRCATDGTDSKAVGALEQDDDWEPVVYGDTLFYPDGTRWFSSTKGGRFKPSGQPSKIPNNYIVTNESAKDRPLSLGGEIPARTTIYDRTTRKSTSIPYSSSPMSIGTKDYFYFCQSGEKAGLYRVKWDGSGLKKIADGQDPILVTGGYIVYKNGHSVDFVAQ